MKIGDGTYRGEEVPLPPEILSLIAIRVASNNDFDTQKSLWACSLVSQTWYAAFISHLYNYPLLQARNFDLFVRTICPLQRTRTARVGLENMIKHLDMHLIAYESSPSITARLINRSKLSLESFLPPSVTFTIASLAPLSKCLNLRLLDMSNQHYALTLNELLHSIGDLDYLASLSLPKDILSERNITSHPLTGPILKWPKTLAKLLVPGEVFSEPRTWDALFKSWPPTLHTLIMPDCANRNPFARFAECQKTADFVQHLKLGAVDSSQRNRPCTLFDILRLFPRLKTILIPVDLGRFSLMQAFSPEAKRVACEQTGLESVKIIDAYHPENVNEEYWWLAAENALPFDYDWFLKIPNLRRLEIQSRFAFPQTNDHDGKKLREINTILEQRVNDDQRGSAGVFLLPDEQV